jgi:hypothetical protein
MPRSESLAVDDVENVRRNEGDNELLHDLNIAYLAHRVSRKNVFLHDHILVLMIWI